MWDHRAGGETPSGIKLQVAAEAERHRFFYADRTHPNDRGHQMLAEMLAHLLLRAAEEQRRAAAPPLAPPVWAPRSEEQEARLGLGLPPPMIPGNVAVPTSLCAIQVGGQAQGPSNRQAQAGGLLGPAVGDSVPTRLPLLTSILYTIPHLNTIKQEGFKPMVVDSAGFQWRPERPEEPSFAGQKWGWTGLKPGRRPAGRASARIFLCRLLHQLANGTLFLCSLPAGDWAELEFDSRADPAAAAAAAAAAAKAAEHEGEGAEAARAAAAEVAAHAAGDGSPAEVLLTYLRSYERMGVAQVKCVAGCACPTTEIDGTWEARASLLQIHRFKVGWGRWQHSVRDRRRVSRASCSSWQHGRSRLPKGVLLFAWRPQVSQHARCRVRVRVMSWDGQVPSGGHKVRGSRGRRPDCWACGPAGDLLASPSPLPQHFPGSAGCRWITVCVAPHLPSAPCALPAGHAGGAHGVQLPHPPHHLRRPGGAGGQPDAALRAVAAPRRRSPAALAARTSASPCFGAPAPVCCTCPPLDFIIS